MSPPKQTHTFRRFLLSLQKKHLTSLAAKPSILASFLPFSGPLRRHVMLMEVYPDYLVSHPGSNYSQLTGGVSTGPGHSVEKQRKSDY